jgi:isopenicillin N synthase-like dioxygenase
MEVLARRLLTIFEESLGLEAGWFTPHCDLDQSTLAANYYSNEIDSGHEPSPYRFKAHVDGSLLTILYQDDGPGSLQLHQRGRGWGDVLPVEGTFVVNLGELMARWTNDHFVATPHRVLRPPAELESIPRLSAPFFFKPNHDAVVAPIPELLATGEAAKYDPVSGRDWLSRDQRATLDGYDSTVRFEELAAVTPILQRDIDA